MDNATGHNYSAVIDGAKNDTCIHNTGDLKRKRTRKQGDKIDAKPKRDKKPKASKRSQVITSISTLAFLPPRVLDHIFSFLCGGSLLNLMETQKFFYKRIQHNKIATKKITSLMVGNTGSLLHMEGARSENYPDIFHEHITRLLHEYPELVIRCDTPAKLEQTTDIYTLINGVKINLQSISPQTRCFSLNQLGSIVRGLINGKTFVHTQEESVLKMQSWYLDADRQTVEKHLYQKPDYTFCIRPSARIGSYALSYKTPTEICHSLIEPWNNWFVSGGLQKDGIIRQVFFTSIPYLVWYWKTQGLGQKWSPMD